MSTRRMHKTDGTTSHKNQTFRHRMQYPSVFSFLPIAVDFDLRGESAFSSIPPGLRTHIDKTISQMSQMRGKKLFHFQVFFPSLLPVLVRLLDDSYRYISFVRNILLSNISRCLYGKICQGNEFRNFRFDNEQNNGKTFETLAIMHNT